MLEEDVCLIENSFMRNMALCIINEDNVQDCLERMNVRMLIKEKEGENCELLVEEWISYLCTSFKDNKKYQKPVITFESQTFTLKWTMQRYINP